VQPAAFADGQMAKINSFNFGFIMIDGKQYVCDVLILPDVSINLSTEVNPT
jgi:hypothetical protein